MESNAFQGLLLGMLLLIVVLLSLLVYRNFKEGFSLPPGAFSADGTLSGGTPQFIGDNSFIGGPGIQLDSGNNMWNPGTNNLLDRNASITPPSITPGGGFDPNLFGTAGGGMVGGTPRLDPIGSFGSLGGGASVIPPIIPLTIPETPERVSPALQPVRAGADVRPLPSSVKPRCPPCPKCPPCPPRNTKKK